MWGSGNYWRIWHSVYDPVIPGHSFSKACQGCSFGLITITSSYLGCFMVILWLDGCDVGVALFSGGRPVSLVAVEALMIGTRRRRETRFENRGHVLTIRNKKWLFRCHL